MHTFWLAIQALTVAAYLFPVSGLVVLFLLFAYNRKGGSSSGKQHWMAKLIHGAFPCLILVVGDVCWNSGSPDPDRWQARLLLGLLLLHGLYGVGLVVKMRDERWRAAAFSAAALWASACCYCVANMAVTNVWP